MCYSVLQNKCKYLEASTVKACRTRELSAELTPTRAYCRKQKLQNPPMRQNFAILTRTRDENLSKFRRTRGILLMPSQ